MVTVRKDSLRHPFSLCLRALVVKPVFAKDQPPLYHTIWNSIVRHYRYLVKVDCSEGCATLDGKLPTLTRWV